MAIVKSHEGIINVTSEVNKGSCFEVLLPATEIDAGERGGVMEETRLLRGHGETIFAGGGRSLNLEHYQPDP